MQASVLKVTPTMAAEWLKANNRNRNLKDRRIDNLVRAIVTGQWMLNGEAIKIAADGSLLDGQHRLAAIVKAGIAVEVLVVTGLPNEAQDTMDSGAKRTSADVFAIHGETNANVLAAVSKRVALWESGNLKFSNPQADPNSVELLAMLERYPSLRRSAEMGARVNSAFRPAGATVVGTAHHILHHVDAGTAAEFFAKLGTGAALNEGDPILTLRNRLMRDRDAHKRYPFHVYVALQIRAWNAVREGRELAKIIHTADEPMVRPV